MSAGTRVEWRLPIAVRGGDDFELALHGGGPSVIIAVDGGVVDFELPEERHVYLSSRGDQKFADPPEHAAWALSAGTRWSLRGRSTLTGEGAAQLWIIEYDSEGRAGHQTHDLGVDGFHASGTTQADRAFVVAVRLSGRGRLELDGIELETRPASRRPSVGDGASDGVSTIFTGPRGQFRSYSVFFDPSGYRRYSERHHRFYDEPRRDWYSSVAARLKERRAVLELGCGPGYLLEALRAAGVERVVGLERDSVYLAACAKRGLPVIGHDLNWPFPFVESDQFDAVVSHSSFDYLAPIAMRGALREALRVLEPGGLLYVKARRDGQASGDVTRTVRLAPELLRRLVMDAGFEDVSVQTRGRVAEVEARKPRDSLGWDTRSVILSGGYRLHPWHRRQPVVQPDELAWDNTSARDFTVLTSRSKDELRVDGQLVAYYTGYRRAEDHAVRAVCRAVSTDGIRWQRDPTEPVILASPSEEWEADGVAAGSVVPFDDDEYAMYYSGRSADGRWPGVGLARSHDGVSWRKEQGPVLTVDEFDDLRHLALADVIQTSSGRWLMHCEGSKRGVGWGIFQAWSDDGLRWRPTQAEPVLAAAGIGWGGVHVANPKVVEIEDGRYLLGFNAADHSGRFQLGLAESDDARTWRLVDVDPVICTTERDYRIESFFLSRDACRRGDWRTYFFSSSTAETHTSSEVLTVEADRDGAWLADPWRTSRWGLYRVRLNRLIADAGTGEPAALTRTVALGAETQCSLAIAPGCEGHGGVSLAIEGASGEYAVAVDASGFIHHGDVELAGPPPASDGAVGTGTALTLRVVRAGAAAGFEVAVTAWHGSEMVVDVHEPLPFAPESLRITVCVPAGEPSIIVDHIDVWQPAPVAVERPGDAHLHMGVCRDADPVFPDIDEAGFRALLRRYGIGRALVTTYGSTIDLDTFGQMGELATDPPGSVFPLARIRDRGRTDDASTEFTVNQLEVLWQAGLLYGVKVKMNAPELPSPAVLEWLERTQTLSMWHVSSASDLAWLRAEVLEQFSFPVLLSHFGGYPLDRIRYEAAIALLDEFPQLYLVTSMVWFAPVLEAAIRRHPDRVLLGSDHPLVLPTAARATIETLPIPAAEKVLVTSEALRFLTERVQWHRWEALLDRRSLRFSPLPRSAEEMFAQGFEIVPPDAMPVEESEMAKEVWQDFAISDFFLEHKPWADLIVDAVADLGATSVLEFGCHVGRNLAAVQRASPDARLVGLDINESAVAAGRERFGLDLRYGDEDVLVEFPPGEFDLVFTVSVIDHIPEPMIALERLLRVARRAALFIEVHLPIEGKVVRHFDHRRKGVHESTAASYSWHLDRGLAAHPRVWRLETRPVYLHDSRLGPYYYSVLVFLDPPD